MWLDILPKNRMFKHCITLFFIQIHNLNSKIFVLHELSQWSKLVLVYYQLKINLGFEILFQNIQLDSWLQFELGVSFDLKKENIS